MTVNARTEPVALRVRNPATNTQAAGDAGDLSKAFSSAVTRADAALNVQPTWYPALTPGVQPGDPYTPLIRAFENDKVQVRVLVGAHEEGHNFYVHGQRWLAEPSEPNSGLVGGQMMAISEHFEFKLGPMVGNPNRKFVDYLYQPGAASDDTWNGLWGLIRVYTLSPTPEPVPMPVCEPCPIGQVCPDVCVVAEGAAPATVNDEDDGPLPLPNNPRRQFQLQEGPRVALSTDREGKALGVGDAAAGGTTLVGPPLGVCPSGATVRTFDVSAVAAAAALPGGQLVYNSRADNGGPLVDPTAILYVRTTDLDSTDRLLPTVPIEPLVLRANAGDCIAITLRNKLPLLSPGVVDVPGFNTLPMIVNHFNANQVGPSRRVGLNAQVLHYDVTTADGADVGFNPVQTLAPGGSSTYWWYAGTSTIAGSVQTFQAVEFGGLNLISSDPVKHSNKGAIGALIIEPLGATWTEDSKSRAAATVRRADLSQFRDFALLLQSDINMRNNNGAIPNLFDAEDPEDSGQKALNYKTEPIWKRMGFAPDADLTVTRTLDYTKVLHNDLIGGDPETPVFTTEVGMETRLHVLHPGGHARNEVFMLHGHEWLDNPWRDNSTTIGVNPLSEWSGATFGQGPTSRLTVALLPKLGGAGGPFGVTGDFLYRSFDSFQFTGGMWGLFRVRP